MARDGLTKKCVKTGIDGLDDILLGGLVLPAIDPYTKEFNETIGGSVLLIKGSPGTGKSTIALQIANAFATNKDYFVDKNDVQKLSNIVEVLYFSCEQTREDIKNKCVGLGIHKDNNKKLPFKVNPGVQCDLANSSTNDEIPFSFVNSKLMWIKQIRQQFPATKKVRLLVVDGLNLLMYKEREMFDIEELVKYMRKKALLSILVYDDNNTYTDSIVDMVMNLEGKEVTLTYPTPMDYYINKLSITKSRFQKTALGWHQYKIRDAGGNSVIKEKVSGNGQNNKTSSNYDNKILNSDAKQQSNIKLESGVIVFPSFHFRIHRDNLMLTQLADSYKSIPIPKQEGLRPDIKIDNVNSYDPSKSDLITSLLKSAPKAGSSTVILGNRRTLKTALTMGFLRNALHNNDDEAMLITLLDDPNITRTQEYQLFNKHDDYNSYSRIFPFYFQPGCITTDEFFYYLHKRILNNEKIKWAALWDLTQIEYNFPFLANDPMFLTSLLAFLKQPTANKNHTITSFLMGGPYCKLARPAYEMAENVIFCWRAKNRSDKTLVNQEDAVFAFIDRIEGSPSAGKLYRLQNNPYEKNVEITQIENSKEKANADSIVSSILRSMRYN